MVSAGGDKTVSFGNPHKPPGHARPRAPALPKLSDPATIMATMARVQGNNAGSAVIPQSSLQSSPVRRLLHSRLGGLPRPFWVLWGGTLANRIGYLVEPFLALYLSSARGLSLAATGTVLAANGAGSVFSQLAGGVLADRIGRRATLTFGMLANAVALITLGYVHGFITLLVATFALGLTIDIYRPAASALVADLIPPTERPRAFGLLFWAINLGFSIAMVLGGLLARAGFVWLFWCDAVTCAAFGLMVWRAVPETRATREGVARDPGRFIDVLRDPVMVMFVLLGFATTFVYMQAYTTLPLTMKISGLSPPAYGLAMAVNGLAIIAIQPFAGTWLGRHDHTTVLACGSVLLGTGFGLTSLAAETWSSGATVFVWTLGEIVTASVGLAIVASLAPVHLRGRYNGVYGVAFSAGYLVAPLGGTRLLAQGRPVLWLTCAGLCAVAAVGQFALSPAIRRRAAFLSADSGDDQ